MNKTTNNQNCETCFKITCKQCGWIAGEEDVQKIKRRTLTSCPECGWKPSEKAV